MCAPEEHHFLARMTTAFLTLRKVVVMERDGFYFEPRTAEEVQFILEYEKDLVRAQQKIASLEQQLKAKAEE